MKGKWGIIVAVIIVIVAIIGFVVYGKTEQNLQAEEKRMRVAAKDYFNKYMSSNESTQVYEVTLDMLEEANKNGEDYNLQGLENCDKTKTVAKITINYQNGKPKKAEVTLEC